MNQTSLPSLPVKLSGALRCQARLLGVLVGASVFGSFGALEAAVITAANPSRAAVGTAVTTAVDGDTVVIPAGTANWSTGLPITKAITLQGAGIGQTIIRDDIPYGASPQALIHVTLVANKTTRVTGIEFQPGTRTTVVTSGALNLVGSNADSRRVRVDHCKFNFLKGFAMEVNGALGVIDHNVVLFNQQVGVAYVRHSNFNGSGYGDGSYAAADLFGTDQFIFFEDNALTNTLSGFHLTTLDGWAGSRYVFRRNILQKGSLEVHGTESAGRNRGGRAMEVYDNTFVGDNSGQIVTYFRSGVGVIYSNTVSGYQSANGPLVLLNDRNEAAFVPFGVGNAERAGADGKNPWDVNVPGGPFLTGTVSSSVPNTAITVSGASWTPNQWRGYSISRTSGKPVSGITRSGATARVACSGHGFAGGNIVSIVGADQAGYNTSASITVIDANTFTYSLDFGANPAPTATGAIVAMRGYTFSEVTGNTVNTLTYRVCLQGPEYELRFAPGDTFTLWKVNHSLDQPGRIGGSLVNGDSPTRPAGWNNQTTAPWYEWNNTREGGADLNFSIGHLTIRQNEHYFNNTVKPGYTPFVYPHPLVSGVASTSPTISSIGSQSINTGASTGPINFTVGDAETTASALTVTGSSSNPTLVPNASIVIGGSGASRTVTVTPAAGQSGNATITVNVNDGQLGAGTSFVVTVGSVNTPPVVTITSQSSGASVPSGTVLFFAATATDAQDGDRTSSLVWSSNLSGLLGSGGSFSRTLNPGAHTVTATATDTAGLSGSATLSVTVQVPPVSPGGVRLLSSP